MGILMKEESGILALQIKGFIFICIIIIQTQVVRILLVSVFSRLVVLSWMCICLIYLFLSLEWWQGHQFPYVQRLTFLARWKFPVNGYVLKMCNSTLWCLEGFRILFLSTPLSLKCFPSGCYSACGSISSKIYLFGWCDWFTLILTLYGRQALKY